ncbi:hypothetical protein WA026_004047 [Henosepilachna vigintioctopunctata]|uniref:Uncharacterized protein n=1 Tax=Henosepilachna vigintioctopunctata TaxID=420089 RepID=A0AAW1U8F2_9CUCU
MENGLFLREFEISTISDSVKFHQKIEGDVSCVVWDASLVLAKFLEKRCSENKQYLKGSKVLELGAGLGCVGLTASCLGANVISSDLPECIPLLNLNITSNKDVWFKYGTIKSRAIIWGENHNIEFVPDKIFLADCVYYEMSIQPLIKTLVNLAGPETEVLLSQEMRESEQQQGCWKSFMNQLDQYFMVKYIPLNEQDHEFCSPDILLLQLKKRSNIQEL